MTLAGTPVRAPDADAAEAGEPVLELVGHAVVSASVDAARRTGIGRAAANIRGNLHDDVSVMLLVTLFLAQVADLWTTHVALAQAGLQEKNPLFRALFQSVPGLADAVKLAAVTLAVMIAMAVLPRPRARAALLLAAGISIVAPISNLLLVAHH